MHQPCAPSSRTDRGKPALTAPLAHHVVRYIDSIAPHSQLLPLDSSTLFHADPPPTQTQGALVLTLDKRTRTVDIWGKDDPSSYSAALKKKQHEPKRLVRLPNQEPPSSPHSA